MTRSMLFRLTLLGAAALGMAGCGGHDSTPTPGTTITTPPPPAAKLEDTFGTQFGVDYRAPANSQPVKPASGDIIPLTLTAAPTALH